MTREEAIDVLKCNYPSSCFEELCKAVDIAIKALSAQPEIIRCKECLMHGVCRFEQGLGLDGYCSKAERRTE